MILVSVAERPRWYELGFCDWSPWVEFVLDARQRVRDVRVARYGSCV